MCNIGLSVVGSSGEKREIFYTREFQWDLKVNSKKCNETDYIE